MKQLFTILALSFISFFIMTSPAYAAESPRHITVAGDGSGDFTTISEALRKVRGDMDYTVTVFIKNGLYREKLLINAAAHNVIIEGESSDSTIISWGDYASLRNMGTSETYTVKVEGNDITFKNITIENTAGKVGQAVALYTTGDRLKFINCRLLGNQDTLYTGGRTARLFFDNCYIEGTVDFIFGSATALFNNCRLHGKSNSYITAASTARENPVGYVFHRCKVTTAPEVTKVYLGRPWRPYASTFFIDCELPVSIHPEGWHNWRDPENEKTARYGEYGCHGEGADTSRRVKWETKLTPDEASRLTDPDFLFSRSYSWSCL